MCFLREQLFWSLWLLNGEHFLSLKHLLSINSHKSIQFLYLCSEMYFLREQLFRGFMAAD